MMAAAETSRPVQVPAGGTCTPAEILRAAATLRELGAKARAEVLASRYFSHDLSTFSAGIRDACGGHAGDLAALMTPDLADLLADLLDHAAENRLAAEKGAASVSDESYTLDPDEIDLLTPYALAVARAINGSRT